MPEWLIGVVGITALPLIVFIWKSFQNRQHVIQTGVKVGSFIRIGWNSFDLPVLSGESEESVKERLLTTLGDFVYGMYCGLTGKEANDRK